MKRYMNTALLYAIFAIAGGVFYREFTKFNGFTAKTTLSVVHTHYFLLGMVFFLLLLLLEKSFFFHRCENQADTDCLSYRSEYDCCDACYTRSDPGASAYAFLWYECSNIWHRRNRTYSARRQHGDSAGTDQAQRIGNTSII